jgi:hypothetical protein
VLAHRADGSVDSGRRPWSPPRYLDRHAARIFLFVAEDFTISLPPPTLTSVAPNQGIQGTTAAVTLTGTNFVGGATTVTVGGSGVTAANVVVGQRDVADGQRCARSDPPDGPRTVTVMTAGGTNGAQTFTITPPPPGCGSSSRKTGG